VLDIIHWPVFLFKPQHFGDWILSPALGGTYAVGPIDDKMLSVFVQNIDTAFSGNTMICY
jgi:hypothetical protein